MTMQNAVLVGVGALALLQKRRDGLGIPGPYGANPSQMLPSGTYEITGTGVNFRSAPSVSASAIGMFNSDTSQGDKVVGTPDQVTFSGETATGNGLTWAKVQAQGKEGYVAVEYMAPVGWTAQNNGIAAGGGGGGGNAQPVSYQQPGTATATDYVPWVLGGVAVLGLGVLGWAMMSKKKKHHAHA